MVISATAKFLVKNIRNGKVTYQEVIAKRPDLKDQIDAYMKQLGMEVPVTQA